MTFKHVFAILFILGSVSWWVWYRGQLPMDVPPGRSEVLLWHFWGGEDRNVVDRVVRDFNASQNQYFARAIAMPGNNLQAKLFLSVTGGDPPDLVNQDDPVLADWAQRGVIQALDTIAPPDEIDGLKQWWLPAARRLSTVDDRVYAICNGLDIRALFYNQTMLDQYGLQPPESLEQLDTIANTIAPPGKRDYQQMGYLPDSRRLLAWVAVFGGACYEPSTGRLDLDAAANVAALDWMKSFGVRYGADPIAQFRKTDQSLPGGLFPLFPANDSEVQGRYAVVMDGQWRVRNIEAFQDQRRSQGLSFPEFGVCPLPPPSLPGARRNAGWVNGNFFVIPKGAKNPAGALALAKFWIGYKDPEIAATICRQGGWIPVSRSVIETSSFQNYLNDNPMFRTFVDLANSPDQFPTPAVVGAGRIKRALEQVGYRAIYEQDAKPEQLLRGLQQKFQPAEPNPVPANQ